MIIELQQLKQLKASCLGNSFLIIDLISSKIKLIDPDLRFYLLGKLIASRQDTMLILLSGKNDSIRLIILEKEGSESIMCGNGLMAIGKYLFQKYGKTNQLIWTRAGWREISINKDSVEAELGQFQYEQALLQGSELFYLANVGEPHAVIFSSEEYKDKLLQKYGPIFTGDEKNRNLNIVTFSGNNLEISNRTFERGVNAETMACGTGSACAAAIFLEKILGVSSGLVNVKTTLGNILVSYSPKIVKISTDLSSIIINPYE